MPPVLLDWLITSEYVGGMAISVGWCILLVYQMAAEGQFDKMVSDVEVCMKQRFVTEPLHAESEGTHCHSLMLAE